MTESTITIKLVHGGFVLTTPSDDSVMGKFGVEVGQSKTGKKTEVFTSQGKLMKALRQAIDENSLLVKSKATDSEE